MEIIFIDFRQAGEEVGDMSFYSNFASQAEAGKRRFAW
jgi:hypothetical protein